jgi:hypothetical protein
MAFKFFERMKTNGKTNPSPDTSKPALPQMRSKDAAERSVFNTGICCVPLHAVLRRGVSRRGRQSICADDFNTVRLKAVAMSWRLFFVMKFER